MIAFLSGKVFSADLRCIVMLINGVGYRVLMPLSDISKLKLGMDAAIHIHTHVREDSLELFGFLAPESLVAFENLISVSGIGPRTALGILSGMEPTDLGQAIANGDHQRLTKLPGIGTKTAQRMVLELKDKFKLGVMLPLLTRSSNDNILDDLRSAISHLGYRPQQVDKAVKAVEHMAKQDHPLEAMVKEALRHLS